MAKIFISFLGTSKYIECNYYAENQPENKTDNVRFVQEATIKLHASGFDKYIILLTKQARQVNWESYKECSQPRIGLHECLYLIPPVAEKILPIDIPECVNTRELWDVFKTICDHVGQKDELVIDVTHGFRMLPMLSIVVLNYLKVLKEVNIKGIYYGALESLGSPRELPNIPLEDRNIPLLNLVSFSAIQDWSHAAQNLIKYGITRPMQRLVLEEIKPVLIVTEGKHPDAAYLRSLINSLSKVYEAISNVRGRQIFQNDHLAGKIPENHEFENQFLVPALLPLQDYLLDHWHKIAEINDPVMRVFKAVDLCIEYEWVQEGFTLLRENVINLVLRELDRPDRAEFYDVDEREFISEVLNYAAQEIPSVIWSERARRKYLQTLCILKMPLTKRLVPYYGRLTALRNDMNHGGFRNSPSNVQNLKTALVEINEQIQSIVNGDDIIFKNLQGNGEVNTSKADKKETPQKFILINFSNHPYEKWSERQKQRAGLYFHQVKDVPFPAIDPQLSLVGLYKLAEEYEQKITAMFPDELLARTVHIMGEQTFCLLMVKKLQEKNIYCIASTTERKIEEDGDAKVSWFRFVDFRVYPRNLS